MDAQFPPVSASDIAAAIDWWRAAGVDTDTRNEASGWLDAESVRTGTAPPVASQMPARQSLPAAAPQLETQLSPHEAPAARLGGLAPVPGDRTTWPGDLAGFQRWWQQEADFSQSGAFPRVAPRGVADASLMAIVAQPEEDDVDSLLSGPLGSLLASFLRAAGVPQDAVYFASVLPRLTLRPDWSEVAQAGYGALLAHHINLVKPARLIVFGRDIPALLPHEPAQDSAFLRRFHHDGREIPLLPARDLANLARRGGFRAAFWQHWLEFSNG